MIKLLAGIGIGAVWGALDVITDRQFADLWGFLAGIAAVFVWQA